MKFSLRIVGVIFFAFLLTLLLVAIFTNKKTIEIVLNGDEYTMLLSDSPLEQYRGLSNLTPEDLKGVSGMAFLYSDEDVRRFVMREMKFPLDFVWISKGMVVSINENVPAPKDGEAPIIVSPSPLAIDTVLEFPAGFIKDQDIFIGMQAEIKAP